MPHKKHPVSLTAGALIEDLAALADPQTAKNLAWFFKTAEGQYGFGDKFIGVRVPALRRAALRYAGLKLKEVSKLLASPIHEHRLAALEILVVQFEAATAADAKRIFDFYLRHTDRVNNWDLVDASAPYIAGAYLHTRSRRVLYRLVRSQGLWERRIAIVATLWFIKQGDIEETFRIAETLMGDTHDLIHKAVGWALREAGKVSAPALVNFLRAHYAKLPRTTLRYAIERFPAARRANMLSGNFG